MSTQDEQKLLTDVGRRMRSVRLKLSLSLYQLARLTGTSVAALSRIETGKRDARLTTVAKIATALRVPLSTLLDDDVPRPVDKTVDSRKSSELECFL